MDQKIATKCEHHGLYVRQDPRDAGMELLICPDCDMPPKSRVSAATSIRESVDKQMDTLRARVDLIQERIDKVLATIEGAKQKPETP